MSLEVNRKKIDEILDLLAKGNWQVPEFQREYVWNYEQIKKLINSILNSYPVGLITIWDQPQNNPHTPGEPLKLRGPQFYKEYDENPAVIKLVLDGKQRLTSLAMVFGGFKSKNGKYNFYGEWFLNLSSYVTNSTLNVVVFKKQSEVDAENLDVMSVCIRKQLIPFKHFSKLSEYIAIVHDPTTYPSNDYPSAQERSDRINALTKIQKVYDSFLIPYAEIPNSIDLGDVCEIFDVLNTTGTKVSTFDLLHNLLFRDSGGSFNLRDRFGDCQNMPKLGLLCDLNRQEFFCQIITGCLCATERSGRGGAKVLSIKGPDLINTPLDFYECICAKSEIVDEFVSRMFDVIFGVDLTITELPYPASTIIYFALRWKIYTQKNPMYSIEELDAVFKAFYWRNVLSNRYDQGFLTQFSIDLKEIDKILRDNHYLYGQPQWVASVNESLESFFGINYPVVKVDRIVDNLLTEDTRGALKQGYMAKLKASIVSDIVDGTPFDLDSDNSQDKVQIHHIFPKDWCRNNVGANPAIQDYGINCIANLCPLKASTNRVWKANSPSTAIQKNNIEYKNRSGEFINAFIDSVSFEFLHADDFEKFIKRRAEAIANSVHHAQFVQIQCS